MTFDYATFARFQNLLVLIKKKNGTLYKVRFISPKGKKLTQSVFTVDAQYLTQFTA